MGQIGVLGFERITGTCEEFEAAIKDAIALNIPCLLDCHIEKDDKVFPMVAPGAAISEAFGEEKFLDC